MHNREIETKYLRCAANASVIVLAEYARINCMDAAFISVNPMHEKIKCDIIIFRFAKHFF